MLIPITIEVVKKGMWYIARAVELDFVTQGRTADEAKKNLFEVIEIQFEEMNKLGTLEDYLKECGYEIDEKMKVYPELIALEKTEVPIQCR